MSVELERLSVYSPTPLDVVTFLPYACHQLEAPFQVIMQPVTIKDYVSEKDDKGKTSHRNKHVSRKHFASSQRKSVEKVESQRTAVTTDLRREDEVVVTTVCDATGSLVEILFYRCTQIPRLLMKVIALCIPYQMLLSRITIRWGPLNGFVLHEIAKVLPQSHITEICLDDSPVDERNYYVLLGPQSQLRSLSLARCDVDDDACVVIASKLRHAESSAGHLSSLCLASNAITDTGATALGAALRSNRTLRYLNLSGNRITDDGAASIFRSLARFHLTPEELFDKRRRIFEYLKLKKIYYTKCYNQLITASMDKSLDDKSSGKRRLTARSKKASTVTPVSKISIAHTIVWKAEAMADELLGPLVEPFNSEKTVCFNDCVYSVGNMNLCYLNLAYNNLEYTSVQMLLEVLRYQVKLLNKEGPGLLRVVLDGNRLPVACAELSAASELLASAVAAKEVSKLTQRRSERFKNKLR